MNPIRCLVAILVFLLYIGTALADKNLVIVFDGSGSMAKSIEAQSRISVAKRTVEEIVEKLPDTGYQVGVIAYGHRRDKDCLDIEALVPLGHLDKGKVVSKVEAIRPKGKTPIGAALRMAGEQLKPVEGEKSIILLTDGDENCGEDPAQIAKNLQSKFGISTHVVGFEILKPKDAKALRAISEQGGGVYLTAATVESLDEAMNTAMRIVETGQRDIDIRVQENTEIILDCSLGMKLQFDKNKKQTRIQAAGSALRKILENQAADRETLAYRPFGGLCKGVYLEPVVPFALNNADIIIDKTSHEIPLGKRTLVDAILDAVKDFEDKKRFDGVNKKVVVITGGVDECTLRNAGDFIRRKLANRKININFNFIGIQIPESDFAEFMDIAKAVGASNQVETIITQEQLEKALERVFDFEPVFRNLGSMVSILTGSIDQLNKTVHDLNNEDFSAAQGRISKAREGFEETKHRFRDMGRRRSREAFTSAFAVAGTLRELQSTMTDKMAALAEVGRDDADDTETYNRIVDEYNDELLSRYDKNTRLFQKSLEKINQLMRAL